LRMVQTQIRAALDRGPAGPLRVISLCAGQGRDPLGVLADHPRRDDVRARLVELDARNTALAEERVRAAGLRRVEVVTADAGSHRSIPRPGTSGPGAGLRGRAICVLTR
jgi:hypothetical protein